MKTPLIIRPEQQGKQLCASLKKAGYTPCLSPLIRIVSLPLPAHFTSACQQADLVIVTSQHCVQQALQGLKTTTCPTFAIGPTTAKALAHHHIASIYPQNRACTETLLPCIAQHIPDLKNKNAVILQGKSPRPLLTQSLQHAKVTVKSFNLYQRLPINIDAHQCCQQWIKKGIDSVIITSGELLNHLVRILKQAHAEHLLHSWVAYVISPRLSKQAKVAGFKQIFLTQGVSDHDIITALER